MGGCQAQLARHLAQGRRWRDPPALRDVGCVRVVSESCLGVYTVKAGLRPVDPRCRRRGWVRSPVTLPRRRPRHSSGHDRAGFSMHLFLKSHVVVVIRMHSDDVIAKPHSKHHSLPRQHQKNLHFWTGHSKGIHAGPKH